MTKKGKGKGWHKEPTRHRLAQHGVKTVLPDGRRLSVNKFVAQGVDDCGLVLYARKELTDDSVLKKYSPDTKRYDVVFYKDKGMKKKYATYPWHYDDIPDRRNKKINFGGAIYRIVWVD